MGRGRVLVIGSANMDLVVRTPRFPEPGETVRGSSFGVFPGGKGANQAAAIGRLGGRPQFLAKVGCDAFGRDLLHALGLSGVDTGEVIMDPALATGIAAITVADDGQNTIVVSAGANASLTPEETSGAVKEIIPAVLLVQLEIPMESVTAAAAQLSPDALLILNPAPAPTQAIPPELLARVDYLTPNETETETLTGIYPKDDDTCAQAAQALFERGVRNVLFTLGAQGSFLANPIFGQNFPALSVIPVDTTAAGDAFNGAFAYFLAEGRDVEQAIALANVAAAISTERLGAIASMPTLREVLSRQ